MADSPHIIIFITKQKARQNLERITYSWQYRLLTTLDNPACKLQLFEEQTTHSNRKTDLTLETLIRFTVQYLSNRSPTASRKMLNKKSKQVATDCYASVPLSLFLHVGIKGLDAAPWLSLLFSSAKSKSFPLAKVWVTKVTKSWWNRYIGSDFIRGLDSIAFETATPNRMEL